ncbi:MAG: tyrosine-type recombinase/integrase [Alphaproteobacteria bacterium]|nr:tyrosine-type recombinase/integrase [Alphaproteobacteria bacterium]
MEISTTSASEHQTWEPWNKGRLAGQKSPLKLKDVWAIRIRLQLAKQHRNLALFNLAIDSKLRACDLVRLRLRDVWSRDRVNFRATIRQKKTRCPVRFEITEQTRDAIARWVWLYGHDRDDYLFPSRKNPSRHLSARQYARLVASWVNAVGLNPSDYGTHSLRRTKAAMIYRRTGNLRAVQLLLGHTKLESTVRYLGIEVDDALEIAEGLDL